MFQSDVVGFDENEEDAFLDDIDFSDGDIDKEIQDFAAEETNMVKDDVEGDEDDENPSVEIEGIDKKPAAIDTSSSARNQGDEVGGTEEAAITLLSSDESDSEDPSTHAIAGPASFSHMATTPEDIPLTDCKLYQVAFPGNSIGVDICEFRGRILVDAIGRERRNRLGPESKPSVGDIFVAINNIPCPMNWQTNIFRQFVQHAFSTATRPVRVTFAEVPSIQNQFLHLRAERDMKRAKVREDEKGRRKLEDVDPSDVIEIESDDSED